MTQVKELPAHRLTKEEILKFWVRDRNYRSIRGGGYFNLGKMEDAQAARPTLLSASEIESFWISKDNVIDDISDPGYWNLTGVCQAVLDKVKRLADEQKAKEEVAQKEQETEMKAMKEMPKGMTDATMMKPMHSTQATPAKKGRKVRKGKKAKK